MHSQLKDKRALRAFWFHASSNWVVKTHARHWSNFLLSKYKCLFFRNWKNTQIYKLIFKLVSTFCIEISIAIWDRFLFHFYAHEKAYKSDLETNWWRQFLTSLNIPNTSLTRQFIQRPNQPLWISLNIPTVINRPNKRQFVAGRKRKKRKETLGTGRQQNSWGMNPILFGLCLAGVTQVFTF